MVRQNTTRKHKKPQRQAPKQRQRNTHEARDVRDDGRHGTRKKHLQAALPPCEMREARPDDAKDEEGDASQDTGQQEEGVKGGPLDGAEGEVREEGDDAKGDKRQEHGQALLEGRLV